MQKANKKAGSYVYGLDIGTRSIVGTVGYRQKDRFVVVAQQIKEHESRAMLDGQIHDIGAVSDTIREVTDFLEDKTGLHCSRRACVKDRYRSCGYGSGGRKDLVQRGHPYAGFLWH